MPEIKQFRTIMTGVTAQATGHEKIMVFFSDNCLLHPSLKLFFTHIYQAPTTFPSHLPSIHIFIKFQRKAEKEGK